MKITVQQGDLTKLKIDAIVNPANSFGEMGGGVAGVIRRVGGEQIEEEAVKQAPIPIGQAVVTTAGSLPCKKVIHAPTMVNPAERTDAEAVRRATVAALEAADRSGLSTLAFPGMGTGVGRVPLDVAASTMVKAIRSFKAESLKEVALIGIDQGMVQAFQKAISNV